jgi:cytochrome c556
MRPLAVIALAVACSSTKKEAPPQPAPPAQAPERPRLVRSEPLPKLARDVLHDRMTNHGDDMESLMWTVMMLDYESAASIAERIARTDKLSRPEPDDPTTLNAALPQRFFELQDELAAAAAELHIAAEKRDDAAIAASFGRISRACVACHSLYLELGPVPEQ